MRFANKESGFWPAPIENIEYIFEKIPFVRKTFIEVE